MCYYVVKLIVVNFKYRDFGVEYKECLLKVN